MKREQVETRDLALRSKTNETVAIANNINLELIKQMKMMSDSLEEIRAIKEKAKYSENY
ncbi:hypothetical protein [Salinicoccus sp. CNSTN-B1]